jgi:hypothetical protein
MTAALLLVSLLTSVAFASNGAATQFKTTYTNVATWTCSGSHVINKTIKDSGTCVLSGDTIGFVAGVFTSTSTDASGFGWGNLPPFGVTAWASDYNAVWATSWTITMVNNLDGTFTAKIVAYYAS